jgi:hypothetical protein
MALQERGLSPGAANISRADALGENTVDTARFDPVGRFRLT